MHFRNVEGTGFVHGKQVGGPQLDPDCQPAGTHAAPVICRKPRAGSAVRLLCRRLRCWKPGRSLLCLSAG